MEEKTVKLAEEKNLQYVPQWAWTILIGIIVFVLLLGIIKVLHNKHEEKELKKQKAKTEFSTRDKVTTLPAMYTEYHFLKKNRAVRVKVPSGYSYTCSGGGKKYYHQAQNTKGPEIWGDGNYHNAGKHVAYFDLSYYDEEITVVCEFKKL